MQKPDVYESLQWATTESNPNQNIPISALQFTNSLNLSRTFHQFVLSLQTTNSSPQNVLPALTHGISQNDQSPSELLLRKKSEETVDEPLFFTSQPVPLRFDTSTASSDPSGLTNTPNHSFIPPSLPMLPAQSFGMQSAALCAVAEIVREEMVDFRCLWENCTESFKTRTGLATHCSTHLKQYIEQINAQQENSFLCKWNCCNARFLDIKKLAKHMSEESHIGQTPFLPKIEGKRQPQLIDEKGKKKKLYMCSFPGCGKIFGDSSNRKKHERTHDSNRERFHCSEPGCNRSYSTKTDLNIHLKVHKGEYPHKCTHPNCTKAFKFLMDQRTHDGIMPHVCSVCKKAFREKSRLKSHEDLHKTQFTKPTECTASDFSLQI